MERLRGQPSLRVNKKPMPGSPAVHGEREYPGDVPSLTRAREHRLRVGQWQVLFGIGQGDVTIGYRVAARGCARQP